MEGCGSVNPGSKLYSKIPLYDIYKFGIVHGYTDKVSTCIQSESLRITDRVAVSHSFTVVIPNLKYERLREIPKRHFCSTKKTRPDSTYFSPVSETLDPYINAMRIGRSRRSDVIKK